MNGGRRVSIGGSVKNLLTRSAKVPVPYASITRRTLGDLWPGWLSSKLYVLGIASGGMYTRTRSGARVVRVFFRGPRPYKLGLSRDQWRCLRQWPPHRSKMLNHGGDFGMCGICYPCPGCGSETDAHPDSCPDFGVVA